MAGVGARVRAGALFAWVLPALLACLLPCTGCHRKKTGPEPPDISACTRLEVRDPCGTLNYVSLDTPIHAGIFDSEETKLLRSSGTYAITDPEAVRNFARVIASGTYLRRATSAPGRSMITITCYKGDERVTSLLTISMYVRTAEGNVFRYPGASLDLSGLRSPQFEPFRWRWDCARHQSRLTTDSLLFRRNLTVAYPDPNRWCDLTAKALWRLHGAQGKIEEDAIAVGLFRCPGVTRKAGRPATRIGPTWVSHYAINPACRPNSPGDVVLLFETQAGWNQHGGPELFTFDNHDPKGGCVLLNDGTSRFIRTPEELARLRWKP